MFLTRNGTKGAVIQRLDIFSQRISGNYFLNWRGLFPRYKCSVHWYIIEYKYFFTELPNMHMKKRMQLTVSYIYYE